ncbi:MAG: flagellar biosynthetic protein FliQ [Planctomycetes bacterium]|nr:flagellar biosynthetic protein FliQ [Planctomycetota bacterium]
MTPELVVELFRSALLTALTLSAPFLLTALVTGLTVSVLQTATGVQEQTLGLVPKIAAVALVFFALMPWLLDVASRFAIEFFTGAAALAR